MFNGDRCTCGCLRIEHAGNVGKPCNNNLGGDSIAQHKEPCRGFQTSSDPPANHAHDCPQREGEARDYKRCTCESSFQGLHGRGTPDASSDRRECVHCGHAEDSHVDTRGMKGQRQVPWCNDCNSSDVAAHSFHPIRNTERGAAFEELDPSSGRYHGHTGGGAGYAGKQWVHQHDGGNMAHEHFRQGVHTRDYHATGYQENVPDKLPPDIRDKDINKSMAASCTRCGQGLANRDHVQFRDKYTGRMKQGYLDLDATSLREGAVMVSVTHKQARGGGATSMNRPVLASQLAHVECPVKKSIQGHTHEDDDFDDHRTGEMHFTGYHEHEMTEADNHTHGADDATRLPNGHRIYCAKMGQGPDTDRDNRCNCDAPTAKCGRTEPHTAHGAGRSFCVGNMSAPIAERTEASSASAVPDRVPKTWARIKPKKEYPPEITARARYVPSKREAEVGKRVDTILALRHKFHGTATDRMGKSAADGDCVTCNHQSAFHSTESDGACKVCACDAYKRENTCVDCQHGKSEHHSVHGIDSSLGAIEDGCDKCRCIKYREPSVGRWARPRERNIPADKRIDTALALRAKWHGSGHSKFDKSGPIDFDKRAMPCVTCYGTSREDADPKCPDCKGLGRVAYTKRERSLMDAGPDHLDFPESGADLYNHMLTGHGRGSKTGWKLFSGAVDLEHPRVRAQLHTLHLAEHEKSKRPFVAKAAQRLTLSKSRQQCIDCGHFKHDHDFPTGEAGGCGHVYGEGVTIPGHCPHGFREPGEHAWNCEQRMGGAWAGRRGSQPGGATKCECPRSEEEAAERGAGPTHFGVCGCGHEYEAHHWPKAGKQENFCNVGGCRCNGFEHPAEAPDRLPSDIRDMRIDKSHDGGPGPSWDIHTTNDWHGPDCNVTEGKRGAINLKVERWRRNGATKTWKTRPGEFRIPIKHGLKNYAYIDHTDHLYYHPADRCSAEQSFQTKLQVRATDQLPADIRDMKIEKSEDSEWHSHEGDGFDLFHGSHSHPYSEQEPHEHEPDYGLQHCDNCGHIWNHQKDPIPSTCAECPTCRKAAAIREHDQRPKYCRECKADLTGMKAVDIGRHMGGHPEGSRAVVTGLRAGYGGLPERAAQEPANGARHRSIHCAFGHHEGCDKVFQTHPKNPAAPAGRKLTCDCRCHPQDKLPDDIRDMNIEKGGQDRVWHEHARAESFAHFHDVDADGNIKYSDHGHTDAERADVRERALQQFGKREAKDIPDHLPSDIRDRDINKSFQPEEHNESGRYYFPVGCKNCIHNEVGHAVGKRKGIPCDGDIGHCGDNVWHMADGTTQQHSEAHSACPENKRRMDSYGNKRIPKSVKCACPGFESSFRGDPHARPANDGEEHDIGGFKFRVGQTYSGKDMEWALGKKVKPGINVVRGKTKLKVKVPDKLPKNFGKSRELPSGPGWRQNSKPPLHRDARGDVFAISSRRAKLGLFWHGTPSGEVGSGDAKYGLHVGTKRAASEALNARIGTPSRGIWDGKREYGKTPLGRATAGRGDIGSLTGYNSDHKPGLPDGSATYSDGTKIPLTARPNIVPVRIAGPMSNHPFAPHDDFKANAIMSGQKKRGTAKRGYFYVNRGEDEGTVSAVVPSAQHVLRLRKSGDYCGADSDESPDVAEEKLSHGTEKSSPAEFASTCKKRGSYSGLLAPSGRVYAKPGYQEHENMIDAAHMHHDYHGLVNAHGWARLSTKGANMNIDFNHDVMSRDTAANLHQVASIHGRVNGWTCYGQHRGGWEYGRDGASLAEHLEEEAAQKSFRLTQASAGKPPKEARPHANDRGEWGGRRFWSGSVSRIDGRVEEVHPYRTAQNYDFHHRMYMSPGAIERIDHGDSAFFHIDHHTKKPELWTTADDGSGFGHAEEPGLNKDQLRGHIERQVKIHP